MEHRAHAPQDDITWLRPAVTGQDAGIGWIGGAPCLPQGAHWPQSDGAPATFLAQIDLSALPHGLWRGYGPRDGWLRLFLRADGTPHLLRTPLKGTPAPTEDTGPAWPLALAPVPGRPEPAPPFDLTSPACQPVDLATARALLTAVDAELDRAQAFLDALSTEIHTAPQDRPGANGIWGRILRSRSSVAPQKPVIANPGLLLTGSRDIAAARAILSRLTEVLDRAREPLPRGAIALLCDTLGHVDLPLFQTEAAPDVPVATGEADPIRIHQRNVPVTRSAKAPQGMPGSSWAERWQAQLTARALHLLARTPEAIPAPARAAWARTLTREAAGAACALGEVRETADGPLAVLMRLPATPLFGWEWGSEALEICLPLAALADGDLNQCFALWPEAPVQPQ